MCWHANGMYWYAKGGEKNFGVCEDLMRKKYSILTKFTMIIQYNFLLIAYTICRDHVHQCSLMFMDAGNGIICVIYKKQRRYLIENKRKGNVELGTINGTKKK